MSTIVEVKMDDLQRVITATESYLRLLKEAEECRRLHKIAGVQLPPPLLALFGADGSNPSQMSLGMSGPDIDSARLETKPQEANEKWISLRAEDGSPTTVALAHLRAQNGRPIRARELSDLVTQVLPNAATGSIYNLLNRLHEEGLIEEHPEGWTLNEKDSASILSGGFLWAPPERLAKQDLAAHRREAIIHLLRKERYLQVMQIVSKLRDWSWVKAPINKDLLKGDMAVLEEKGLARRIGNSRNWEVVPGASA